MNTNTTLTVTPTAREVAIKKVRNIGHAIETIVDGLAADQTFDAELAAQAVDTADIYLAQLCAALGIRSATAHARALCNAQLQKAEDRIRELEAEVVAVRTMSRIFSIPEKKQN